MVGKRRSQRGLGAESDGGNYGGAKRKGKETKERNANKRREE